MFNNPLIHPTALIHENAKLGKNVSIGPYTIIGSNCSIGDGTIIDSHCVIDGQTSIGSNCHIFPSVSIGLIPQDYNFKGEETGVSIGNNNIFREFVTIHRATGQGLTKIGDNCFFMNYVHIAHNCNIGNGVIIANTTNLAGHCTVGDKAFISSMCIFHQFTRIGTLAIVGGLCGTRVDLPPYSTCDGRPAKVRGVNIIGMRRAQISAPVRSLVKEAYRIIYRSDLNVSQALERITQELEPIQEIQNILNFYQSSKRGVCGGAQEFDENKQNQEFN